MMKVIVRKINLANFKFELINNDLLEEMKDSIKIKKNLRRLPSHKEPGNSLAPGRNNHVHAEMPLG